MAELLLPAGSEAGLFGAWAAQGSTAGQFAAFGMLLLCCSGGNANAGVTTSFARPAVVNELLLLAAVTTPFPRLPARLWLACQPASSCCPLPPSACSRPCRSHVPPHVPPPPPPAGAGAVQPDQRAAQLCGGDAAQCGPRGGLRAGLCLHPALHQVGSLCRRCFLRKTQRDAGHLSCFHLPLAQPRCRSHSTCARPCVSTD